MSRPNRSLEEAVADAETRYVAANPKSLARFENARSGQFRECGDRRGFLRALRDGVHAAIGGHENGDVAAERLQRGGQGGGNVAEAAGFHPWGALGRDEEDARGCAVHCFAGITSQ